jgi:hypothetical protein
MRQGGARDAGLLQPVVGSFGKFGGVSFGDGADFGADGIGGKPSAKKTAVQRCDLPLVEWAAGFRHALQALADQRSLIGLGEHIFQGRFDMTIGHAAATQLARDPEFSLAARLRVVTRVVKGIARVVQILLVFQFFENRANQLFIFRAPREKLFHFVNGMRATHQGAQRRSVQFGFSCQFAGV